MKTCFKCHQRKPLSEFYRHPQMGDGRLNKCASCTRRDVQANYAAKRDYYHAYDQSRYSRDRVQRMRERRDPIKHRARVAVYNAIRRGKIARQPCEVCGLPNGDAHHEDYSKPLEVRWLCRKHHGMAHRVECAA